ncbi:MAG: ABC transporter permease [Methanobacteriota archaeon]|nr:MAG: ABC transporter permease [Euryarchaeota archaeon]
MAEKPRRASLADSLRRWIPRQSILGRILFPLIEERRSLPAVLTWLGIGIVIVFVFIAIASPLLAPWDPYAFVDGPDVPPWTNAPVLANSTYFSFSPTPWMNMTAGQAIDGRDATSKGINDTVVVSSFLLRVFRDAVTNVSYVILLDGRATTPGHYLGLEWSADGGATWSPRTAIRTFNQFVRMDLTPLRSWNLASVEPGRFSLRFTHLADTNTAGQVALNYAAFHVVWLSFWHLMGTDPVGRDVFSRVLVGTGTSLQIMAIGVFAALLVGFPLGLFSGYTGGRIDKVLVLVMDSLYAFPGLLLAGLIAVLIGKGVVNIGLAVTVIYIPLYFRATRSHVLSAREELYVEAARALGAKPGRILWRYIAYNVLVAIPVIFSLSAADAVLTAAGLSYLGLGVQAPTADWGLDLSAAASRISVGIWWSSFFPGLVIVILTIGLSFLGEGLNDIVNPVLRRERS